MFDPQKIQSLKDALEQQKRCIVLFSPWATVDMQAAGLALAAGLQELGKEVRVVMPPASGGAAELLSASLPGADRVSRELANQNLVIEFPCEENQVANVSCATSDDKRHFSIFVSPQQGMGSIDSSQVSFRYTGVEADMYFTVGVLSLEELNPIYNDAKEFFSQTSGVAVASVTPSFGAFQFETSGFSSLSEGIWELLKGVGVSVPSADLATLIVAGIEAGTSMYLSPLTKPATFSLVGELLAAGGRRLRLGGVSGMTPMSANGMTGISGPGLSPTLQQKLFQSVSHQPAGSPVHAQPSVLTNTQSTQQFAPTVRDASTSPEPDASGFKITRQTLLP